MANNSKSILTRSKTVLWLIGSEENTILGCKLPSNRQVLKLFFHYHQTIGFTNRQSATAVIRDVMPFWNKARIPVRQEHHSIAKLEQLHEKWMKLQKNASRESETQRTNETKFMDQLDNLFDIAHQDALQIIQIEE